MAWGHGLASRLVPPEMACALVGWGRQGHSFLNCRGPGDAQGQIEAAAAASGV